MEVIRVVSSSDWSPPLDEMPPQLMRLMDNVAVVVADRHPTEDLLGLYEGVPLTERGDYGGMVMPDVVTLYGFPSASSLATRTNLSRR